MHLVVVTTKIDHNRWFAIPPAKQTRRLERKSTAMLLPLTLYWFTRVGSHDSKQHVTAIGHINNLGIGLELQWATKVLRHFAVKFDFRAS